MNYNDWYTDTVSVWRVKDVSEGALTHKQRTQVYEAVPCRLYQSFKGNTQTRKDAAKLQKLGKVACGTEINIQKGDEIQLIRGGAIGKKNAPERYYVGESQLYLEPFGAVLPGLEHREFAISSEEWV